MLRFYYIYSKKSIKGEPIFNPHNFLDLLNRISQKRIGRIKKIDFTKCFNAIIFSAFIQRNSPIKV